MTTDNSPWGEKNASHVIDVGRGHWSSTSGRNQHQ